MERQDQDLAFMLQYENVAWYEDGKVRILDRRVYPTEIKFVECNTYKEVAKAITDMVTQSAGPYTAAGMGMTLAAYEVKDKKEAEQIAYLTQASYDISHARPTTANRMGIVTEGCLKAAKEAMEKGANPVEAIFNRTIDSLNRSCCSQMGFDTTVITDNMVAYTMQHKNVNLFTSAADTIARDGHIANKIGTYQIAILAKYFRIPYFVTGIPDEDKLHGSDIIIEERDPAQVLSYRGIPNTLPEVKGIYPSFDITPPHLISGIVTDKGVYTPYVLNDYFDSKVKEFY